MFDGIRKRIGMQPYEIQCPGVVHPYTKQVLQKPHRAEVWGWNPPSEGTLCRNCVLYYSSLSENLLQHC